MVLERNPTLDQMRATAAAAAARYPQVTALDDPTFAFTTAPGSAGAANANYAARVEVSQKLLYPGKRALKGSAAKAEAVPTKLTVPDMDCASCAKKVGNKVAEVKGVGKVEYSVQGRTITVTPKANETLSPKALWGAVVAAGQEPSELEGPAGTFTSKPKQ